MKKIILLTGLTALTGAVSAQSTVTLSGFVRTGVERYSLLHAGARPEYRLSDQSSRLVLSGSESLGNGWKAFFVLDNRFQIDLGQDAPSALASGNSGVGISGPFGQILFGRWNLQSNEGEELERGVAISDQTLLTHGVLSQVANAFNVINGVKVANAQSASRISRASRSDNLIKYDTPNWNGWHGTLAYSFNPLGNEGSGQVGANGASQSKGGAWQAAIRYADERFNAGFSRWEYTVEGDPGVGNQRASRAWVGYRQSDGARVGLILDRSEMQSAIGYWSRRFAWALPLGYVHGPHNLYLSYASLGNVNQQAGTGARQWVVGYEFVLSKRTQLGTNVTQLTNGAAATYDFKSVTATGTLSGTATGVGQGALQIYAGINHSF